MASQHTFQILTKRPERMREYFEDKNRARWICDRALDVLRDEENPTQWKYGIGSFSVKIPLDNVWLGTSVEDRVTADDRIPQLLQTPATIHFLSCEPLLEQVTLDNYYKEEGNGCWSTWIDYLDWIIVGGESGPGSRPCNIDWIRSIVHQCRQTKTAVFVKQLGSNPIQTACYIDGIAVTYQKLKLKDRKGGDISEFSKDLRVREFPSVLSQ